MKDITELYGGKYVMVFNEGSHRYTINGNYVNGVTTMLGLLGKDGLIQWSANMAVEAMLAGADPKDAKYAWMKKRDKAGDIGTRVHAWIEAHIQSNDLPIEDDMKPSIDAFLKWEYELKPVYLHSERKVYSQRYDYAGTVDIVFEANGAKYVADFKTADPDKEYKKYYTGKLRARKEHFYQNALYDQAMIEEGDTPADKYMVIYVTKSGELHTFETDRVEQMKEASIKLVEFYKLDKVEDKENIYG